MNEGGKYEENLGFFIPVIFGGVVTMYLSIMSGLTFTETIISGLVTLIVGGLVVKYWGSIWRKTQMLYWEATGHPKAREHKTALEKIESGLRKRQSKFSWWWRWWERRRNTCQ